MRTLIFILAFMSGTLTVSADPFDFSVAGLLLDRGAVKVPEAAPAKAMPPEKGTGEYFNLRLNIRRDQSLGEIRAREAYNEIGIEVAVRKLSGREFAVFYRAGDSYGEFKARKVLDAGYQLSGGGIFLDLAAHGGSFAASGSVTGADGRPKSMKASVSRKFDKSSWYMNAFGLGVNIDAYRIDGTMDKRLYPRKTAAAIISLLLVLQLDRQ